MEDVINDIAGNSMAIFFQTLGRIFSREGEGKANGFTMVTLEER